MATPIDPTLVDLMRAAARRWPGRTAIVFDADGQKLTFAEFDHRTDAIAAALIAQGVVRGDRILVSSANTALFPLAWFGILKAGAVMVPINIAYRAADARHLAELAEPVGAFCDVDRAPAMAALQRAVPSLRFVVGDRPDGAPARGLGWRTLDQFVAAARPGPAAWKICGDDLTNIQFTSGTSGLPKGCMLTHRYWLSMAAAVRDNVLALTPDDVMLTAQAFSYLDPQWALVLTLMSGSRLVVLERFRPAILWDKIVEHDASFFYCIAAMPLMMLSAPRTPQERAHRLHAVMCSAIPPDRHGELEERFGVPWLEAYGSTETGSDLGITLREHDATRGTGTIGRPLPHRTAMIADDSFARLPDDAVGELLVGGADMMTGYWRDTEATAAAFNDGWYRTGDLARRDPQGLYYLVGRRKDMIRRAGENIAAAEVEGILQQHPAIELAACIAVPDAVRHEEVKMFVVPRAPVTIADLISFLETRLAWFKVPRYWQIVDALPMTPSARVAKPSLSRAIAPPVFDRVANPVDQDP